MHYKIDFSGLWPVVEREEQEEDLNVDWDVLTDPTRFVEQPKTWKGACEEIELPDVLTFGTALYEPPKISHIPVVDKMGNPVLDATVSPTRHHPKMDNPANVTKEMVAIPADCDCIHCAQERAKAKGMVLEDHTIDALVTAFQGIAVHDMMERIKDHGAIEGECEAVHPDTRKKDLLIKGPSDVPGYRLDHTVEIGGQAVDYYKQNLDAPETEIPTTELDLENNPDNWDNFLDEPSAGAPRHEDGDTSK